MNKCILIGRWTKDLELSYTQGGMAIAKGTLAVDGYKKDDTDFINITAFNKLAENVAQYSGKGRLVAIEGSIKTGSYENKEGKRVYTFGVMANNIKFLDFKKDNEKTTVVDEDLTPVEEMDLPF